MFVWGVPCDRKGLFSAALLLGRLVVNLSTDNASCFTQSPGCSYSFPSCLFLCSRPLVRVLHFISAQVCAKVQSFTLLSLQHSLCTLLPKTSLLYILTSFTFSDFVRNVFAFHYIRIPLWFLILLHSLSTYVTSQ